MEQLKLNMIPNGVNPVFHASQYDKGRQIRFVLDETLSGAEVTTSYRAKDGTEHGNVQMSVSGNTITDTIPEEVLTDYGIIEGEVSIDGIGSLNFFVEVEKDAYDGGVITTQTATGAIATFETNIETAFVSLKSDINPLQDLHGYTKPWSGGGGKNKLNYDAWKTTTIAGGTAVWENNGVTLTATANDCFTRTNAQVPVTEGETITLSWEETTNKSGNVFIFPNGITTGMVSTNNASHKKLSYTATSGITFVTFRFGVANSGDTIAYKNIQIEKGSQATSWEPYENICPISGFSALNVTRTGKNILPKLFTNTTLNAVTLTANTDGTLSFSGVASAICYFSKAFNLKRGSYIYTSSADETFTTFDTYISKDGTTIARGGNNLLPNSFTLTEDSSLLIVVRVRQGFDTDGLKIYPMIRVSSDSDTEYHAYNGQTASVNFGQTVYGGVADVTNGKLTITQIAHVFDGSENFLTLASGRVFAYDFGVNVVGSFNQNNSLCSHFHEGYGAWDLLGVGEYLVGGGRYGGVNPDMTLADYKTYLQAQYSNGTPVTIVATLATPIEITTTPETLTALSGQTNNVYGDTNGDTEVEYYIEV